MAVSAFKSSSKRGNLTDSTSKPRLKSNFERENVEKSTKKDVTQRRSRSVSAFSRSNSDVTSEFLNKRDNPLFCNGSNSSVTAPPDDVESKSGKGVKPPKVEGTRPGRSGSVERSRGRSIARNAGDGTKFSGDRKEIGRSLSRVDTGRRGRSVSVHPASRYHSESEAEQECSSSSNCLKSYDLNIEIYDGNYVDVARNSSFDSSDGMKSPRTWRSQHPAPVEKSNISVIPSWEVQGLMSSSWDMEQKSTNTVCHQTKEDLVHVEDDIDTGKIYETVRLEVRRAISDIQHDLETAIQRNNKIFPKSNYGVGAPAGSITSGPAELVLDIRKEFAKELEQSQERAQKLRADLALEEHHGIEINRIMEELLPEERTPCLRRSRPTRKSSIERRKISRCLAEEAMTYFDECVSISTFDSSDFSSQEDPPVKLFGATSLVVDNTSIPPGSSSASTTDSPRSCLTNKEIGFEGQQMHVLDGSGLTASGSSNRRTYDHTSPDGTNIEQSRPFQFSFAGKPSGNFGLQGDINSYIKKFDNSIEKDRIDAKIAKSKSNHCDLDEYNMHIPSQDFLLDKVTYKNRIESGSLHICESFPF